MKHGLDIAVFGSSPGSAFWPTGRPTGRDDAAMSYRGVIRALARRGHRVTFYEPDGQRRHDIHNPRWDPDWARVVVYERHGEDGVIRALTEASSADLVIKASGVGVFDELLERAVVEMQRPGTLVAYWDVDAPATLDRLERNPEDPFYELISEYDLILMYGGAQ